MDTKQPLTTNRHNTNKKQIRTAPRVTLSPRWLQPLTALVILVGSNATTQAAAPACNFPACTHFPADAGFVNVRSFGATGDGVHDDTLAILAAIRSSDNNFSTSWWRNRVIYFPEGTYLVSSPIEKRGLNGRYMSGMVLLGASPTTTKIQLRPGASGYGDPSNPKAVVYTASMLRGADPAAGGKDYLGKGEGNDAYENYVENMTVDVGANNPGAIGIDFLANNMGAVRNVIVNAPIGSGLTGISITRQWPGPAIVSNVAVTGFSVGIATARTEYGITFDKIVLTDQQTAALVNDSNSLSINDLSIIGDATGIRNIDPRGLITAVDLKFAGRTATSVAIENFGSMTIRQGYMGKQATAFGSTMRSGTHFEGVYNADVRVDTATPSWSLVPKPMPVPAMTEAQSTWASVQAYGAVGDGVTDSTEAIRRAFNSGASIVYFPYGSYVINDTIEIPASVRRVEGMMSTVSVTRYLTVPFWQGGGIFKVSNTMPVLIERLNFDMYGRGGKLAIEHTGSATLMLRDVLTAGIPLVNRAATGGEVYGENLCCGPVTMAGPKGVWLRQFNSEGTGSRFVNNGSPLWLLGFKTEQNATVVENRTGALTDVLGGLLYLVSPPIGAPAPAFINSGGKLFAAYVEEAFNTSATYSVHLSDRTPASPKTVLGASLAQRGVGRMVPKLVTSP